MLIKDLSDERLVSKLPDCCVEDITSWEVILIAIVLLVIGLAFWQWRKS
jgi:hypothetical protein